ncbi:uncharacterized protein LOC118748149 isoform X2 [Rhagoletis pomonella]|uniref:uncharacterized protein LOC118748149 isoform X2 n=1 Tax=Rhagoletis pomonella TaxID=28610 RepID=UPI001785CA7E|nr:uncharacterized protein LOC118748149 isoform X2 [Rhagoletis pomonella]
MNPGETAEFVNGFNVALSEPFEAIKDVSDAPNTLNGKMSEVNKMEIRNGATLENDYFYCKLGLYSQDETSLKRILRDIYQFVKESSLSQDPGAPIPTSKWADLLVNILFSKTWHKTTISDVLLCLKLYSRTFFDRRIVQSLWDAFLTDNAKSEAVTITSVYVLIQFFDEFSIVIDDFQRKPYVEKFVYKLLLSEGRDERKAAVFLMKKMNCHLDKNVKNFWLSYITVLENLEENQSHLILPSLECLKQNTLTTAEIQPWLDILYIKILAHRNILVLRWALEYILETFTCANINPDVLLQFVKASNRTCLFNHESYFLPTGNMQQFLNEGLDRFMGCMSEVNFKCVPLHFWLSNIFMCKSISTVYSRELILKIAARIRGLQNQHIRIKAIELFEHIFREAISRMPLNEYVVLVESLYNLTDPFNHFDTFYLKIEDGVRNIDGVLFTQRFYEIVTNNLYGELTSNHPNYRQATDNTNELATTQSKLLDKIANSLKNVKNSDKEKLIWILLMLVFECENKEVVQNICRRFWNINLNKLIDVPFEELKHQIVSDMVKDADTAEFFRKKFIDFFVKEYLTNFSDLQNYIVKIEDILTTGSHKTLLKLSKLLPNNKLDVNIIDAFLIALKKYSRMQSLCYIVTTNLLRYLKKMYSPNQLEDYSHQILGIDLENLGICTAVLNSGIILTEETYIKGMTLGDANFGDARTEELYLLKIDKTQCSRLQRIRLQYVSFVPVEYTNAILNELLSMHKALSIKKPRYFENSMEHRIKMRIAKAISTIINKSNINFWNEDLLNLPLNYNNQLNINYVYELLVAKCAPDGDVILNKLIKLADYTPSQQVSLISIVHCYSVLNRQTVSKEYLDVIISKLLPLTMGAHFQTRLYAQLAIYNILDKFNSNDDTLSSNSINMKEAIALAVGPQLKELLNDVRLLLPYIYLNDSNDFYDILMFITMAPADEYLSNFDYSKYELSKCIFCKKKRNFDKEMLTQHQFGIPNTNLTNIQRKMNPENDLCAMSSLRTERAPESEHDRRKKY